MSKLNKDGKPIYNENGKVMKGPEYFKPNLKNLFENYEKSIIGCFRFWWLAYLFS